MTGARTTERETARDAWRRIVASSLDWGQAHVTLARAVDGLPARLRGRRPQGSPYSVWELLEHIRITQRDLLEFCTNPAYREPEWPDDYWPHSPEPESDGAWEDSLAAIERDREELRRWTETAPLDLTAKIPHGTGQTYLRTVLVALDHLAYHTGQIVLVRRLLGAWEG
ncbi:MAG TPA: DinB family protein [Longimicrobiales bacterium]|nr:DinB family protein [Longimicrobiales bacterium]